MTNDQVGGVYFVGSCITSLAIGYMAGDAVGALVFGFTLMIAAVVIGLFKYLPR